MRHVLVTLLVCMLLTSCAASTAGSGPAAHVDEDTPALRQLRVGVDACVPGTSSSDLPKVTLPCLGGGKDVDLSKLQGPLVINLFAQWCGPCRGELPYYQRLHVKAKGTVAVLGVDYLDTQPSRALLLARQARVSYPLVADPSGLLRPGFKIRGLPGVVFVDKAGRLTDIEFRVVRSYAELRGLVRQHLGVQVPG